MNEWAGTMSFRCFWGAWKVCRIRDLLGGGRGTGSPIPKVCGGLRLQPAPDAAPSVSDLASDSSDATASAAASHCRLHNPCCLCCCQHPELSCMHHCQHHPTSLPTSLPAPRSQLPSHLLPSLEASCSVQVPEVVEASSVHVFALFSLVPVPDLVSLGHVLNSTVSVPDLVSSVPALVTRFQFLI